MSQKTLGLIFLSFEKNPAVVDFRNQEINGCDTEHLDF